jgi:competence protein ComEC
MSLVLVALLWLAMVARAYGVSSFSLQVCWLFWPALIAVAVVWWKKRKPKFRVIAAAVIPVALVFGFTGATAHLNPRLSNAANSFTTLHLELESSGVERFGHLPVRVVAPNELAGNGELLVKQQLPKCANFSLSGNFLMVPPSDKSTATNQFLLRAQGEPEIACKANPLDWIDSAGAAARNNTAQAVRGISQDSKALVLGLTDGDTQFLSKPLNAQLKTLSLTHLNAVSGANCAIVVTSVFGLLALVGFGRRSRVLGALVALAAYLVLVGNQPSVIRAAAMACIALFAVATGKRALGLNVLALGVLLLLGIFPNLAVNFGFALSALATWGVIQLAPAVQQKLQAVIPNWLALMVAVSLSAQLACLPVLVLLQTNYSLFSTLANVLVEPAVPIITVLGVVGALVAQIWAPLATPLFWLASIPAQYLVGVARYFSSIPASINWPAGALGVALAIALVWAVAQFTLGSGKSRWFALTAVLTIFVGFASAGVSGYFKSSGFASGDWFYVACDVGQGDATVIRSQGHVAVIDAGREPEPVNACLKRLGVQQIDLLLLTHFDLDHVGGVAGVLDHRQIQQAFFTAFIDDRPGAQATQETVASAGIPIRQVAQGDAGNLGDFQWLVLSPHAGGADALDSNDGSVTMFFHSARVNIVTLADLPETGQIRLAKERYAWWRSDYRRQPLIMKVSHHGSADQFPEFIEWLRPQVATVSVGLGNTYGHPTKRTLDLLHHTGALVLRTDLQGALSLSFAGDRLVWGAAGAK